MTSEKQRVGSLMTIRRLPAYLAMLKRLNVTGREFVSTTHIAEELKLQPEQIRKDIALTGIVGKPKVGYHVPALIKAIEEFLCWDDSTNAFLVGAGNLGSALLGYKGFQDRGLNVMAVFDSDQSKVGCMVHDLQILSLDRMVNLAKRMHVRMGIIAVPAENAQEVANLMVTAGIIAIWNFAPVTLEVPDYVVVQNEDLSSGLAVLSVKLANALQACLDGEQESDTEEESSEAESGE